MHEVKELHEAVKAFLDGASERLRAINVEPTLAELGRRVNCAVSTLSAARGGSRLVSPSLLAAWIAAWNETEPQQVTLHKTGAGWEVEWWEPFVHNGRRIGLIGKKGPTGFFYVAQRELDTWNVSWAAYDTWPGATYLNGQVVAP